MYMLERHYDELTKGLEDRTQLQAVNITNAAAWFFKDTKNVIKKHLYYDDTFLVAEGPQDEAKYIAWKWNGDFPAVIPPFPVTWMEYKVPKWISDGDIGDSEDVTSVNRNADTIGYLIRAEPSPENDGWIVTWESWFMLNARYERRQRSLLGNRLYLDESNGTLVPWWKLFGPEEMPWEGSLWRSWKMTAKCNRQGELIKDSILYFHHDEDDEDGEGYEETEATIEQKRQGTDEYGQPVEEYWTKGYDIWSIFHPVLFATSLMHAKNVHLVDNPLPPAVAKRRRREGKPVVTFKTLAIDSMRKLTANTTEGGDTSAKRAMHIVRGHFKDYRNSGGLFGKHQGLYWWDMHVAGDDKFGKVIKDYKI
jgi:hypothetical protein